VGRERLASVSFIPAISAFISNTRSLISFISPLSSPLDPVLMELLTSSKALFNLVIAPNTFPLSNPIVGSDGISTFLMISSIVSCNFEIRLTSIEGICAAWACGSGRLDILSCIVFIVSRNTATCSNASGSPESEERVEVMSSRGFSLVIR